MVIAHFDVDTAILPLLRGGETYAFPVTPETISQTRSTQAIEAISIKSQSHLTPSVLSEFPKLKLIISRTVGTDHIDLSYCKQYHIAVYRIPDYGSQAIAEHALGLLLAGARHIPQANSMVHTGQFSYAPFLGMSLKGKTIGVIGTGKIGLSFIELISSFGVTILAYDIFPNMPKAQELNFSYVPKKTLVSKSDAISLHVPLSRETYHLFGEEEFSRVKPGAILVNTSRGGVLDTEALLRHIKRFSHVCLDVVEDEEHFSESHPILKYDTVILTPHIGFYTDETVKRIAEETNASVSRFLSGDSEGRVL